jgi:Ca2+-transporting ATPase
MIKVYPSVAQLPAQYHSDAVKGLAVDQVEVNRRQYGGNDLSPIKQTPLWRQFLEKFQDATIIILCIAALISLLIGLYSGHFLDGIAILAAVFIATTVGFFNEYKSNKEFELLNRVNEDVRVKVTRNGQFQTLPIGELVVGDIIHLYAGDKIPADARLLYGVDLTINQSLLTGESEEIAKDEKDVDLFRGTTITEGNGIAIVTAVGDATELGKIKDQLVTEHAPTPLQEKLDDLAGKIGKAGMIAAVLTFLALTVVARYHDQLSFNTRGLEQIVQFFIIAVTIVVVAVPEGLPLAVTVSLAFSMRKMARDNNLVRRLSACETIGAANVICSDKTGTLTRNQMTVQRLMLKGKARDARALEETRNDATFDLLALSIAANSTGHLEERNGGVEFVGNATECSLLAFLRARNVAYELLREENPVIERISFSSQRKIMISVIQDGDRYLVLAKGAPEKILPLCARIETEQGKSAIADHLPVVNKELEYLADEAMRTLAFAYKHIDNPEDDRQFEKDLTLLAIVGIADPLRDDVRDAIGVCQKAGVDVKMLTGDSVKTATAIAKQLGLMKSDGLVMDGEAFQKLSDQELKEQAPRLCVLARSTPLDKLRLVSALKARRLVVAVTGDGTNDAPALKQADVGLSMGRAGTELAKEASDIVLLDDNFSSIVRAINWGRSLFENIQKFIQFQLTVNVAALAIAFFGALFGFGLPLTAIQLLWVNLIMDTLAALALGLEPPTEAVMNRAPRRRDDPIITPHMWRNIFFTAGYFFAVLMLLLKYNFLGAANQREQYTVIFTAFVFFQIWNEISCRSLDDRRSSLTGILDSRYFLAIMAIIIVVQFLITQLGGEVFSVTPLSSFMWLKIIALTSTALILSELRRWIGRISGRRETTIAPVGESEQRLGN